MFVCFVEFQGFGDGSTILVAPLRGLNQPLRSSGTGLAEPPQRPAILEGPGSSLGLHTFSILLMEIAEVTSLFQKSSFLKSKASQTKETTNIVNVWCYEMISFYMLKGFR